MHFHDFQLTISLFSVAEMSSKQHQRKKKPKNFLVYPLLEKLYHYIWNLWPLPQKKRVPDQLQDWHHQKLQVLDQAFIGTRGFQVTLQNDH